MFMVPISTNGNFAHKSATHREKTEEPSIPRRLMRIILIFFLRKAHLNKSSSTATATTQRGLLCNCINLLVNSYGVMKAVSVKLHLSIHPSSETLSTTD